MTLTHAIQISVRRRTNPPALWVTFMLGSVFIHLFAIGIFHWLTVRPVTSKSKANTAPVAVDIAVDPKSANSKLLASENSRFTRPESGVVKDVPPSVSANSKLRDRKTSKAPVQKSGDRKDIGTSASPLQQKNRDLPAANTDVPLQNSQLPLITLNQAQRSHSTPTLPKRRRLRVNRQRDKKFSRFTPPSATRSTLGTQERVGEPQLAQNQSQTPPSVPNNTPANNSAPLTSPSFPGNNLPPSQSQSQSERSPTAYASHQEGGSLVAILSDDRPPATSSRDIPDPDGWAKPLKNLKEVDYTQHQSPILKNLARTVFVRLFLVIDDTGKVESARVVKTSGNGEVDRHAIEILQNWKFKPATQGGQPVWGELEVDIRFAPGSG